MVLIIKLNNLNNVKIKKKSNDNAYLKVKNQEYEKIGMLIDSIETDSNSTVVVVIKII